MKADSLERYFELLSESPKLFYNERTPFRVITDINEIECWKQQHLEEDIGVVYEDSYICLVRDVVEFPGGTRRGYARLINKAYFKGAKSVAILPEMGGKILLLRQFRHATRSWHLEIPRGFGEEGVSPEDNAVKEITEETEGIISELISLGGYHCNTGLEAEETRLFFARLHCAGSPSIEEGIDRFVGTTVPEAEDLIKKGEITDGFTIAAFTRARLSGLI